jgi:hypothetical protein
VEKRGNTVEVPEPSIGIFHNATKIIPVVNFLWEIRLGGRDILGMARVRDFSSHS